MVGDRDDRLFEEPREFVPPAVTSGQLAHFYVVWKQVCAVAEAAGLRLDAKKVRIVTERLARALDIVDPVKLAAGDLKQPNDLQVPHPEIPGGDDAGV